MVYLLVWKWWSCMATEIKLGLVWKHSADDSNWFNKWHLSFYFCYVSNLKKRYANERLMIKMKIVNCWRANQAYKKNENNTNTSIMSFIEYHRIPFVDDCYDNLIIIAKTRYVSFEYFCLIPHLKSNLALGSKESNEANTKVMSSFLLIILTLSCGLQK